MISSVPLVRKQPNNEAMSFPEVFTACAVMHYMSRNSPPAGPEHGVRDGVASNLVSAQGKMKTLYDQRAEQHVFS